MRILQVITDTDRRGAQVFAADLGAALVEVGHEVITVALAPGTRSSKLDVPVLGSSSRGWRTLRALRRLMRDVDVTIAHGSATLLACGVAGIGPGRPFVYRQISDSRFWASTWTRRLRVAVYLRLPCRIVALSEGARHTLHDYLLVPLSRIDVVPNGVPRRGFVPASDDQKSKARRKLGLPLDGFVVTYTGALVPEKGVRVAVDAVAATADVHLLVVGGGPQEEELRLLASETAPNRVHFAGEMSDVLPAYHAADVVILPSLGGDSMPASLIEAGFCGLPSLSTSVGSIPDVVVRETTGIVTEPGDLEQTTLALQKLLEHVDSRQQMGTAAEGHCVARYEISIVARGWGKCLDRVVNSEDMASSSCSAGDGVEVD